MICGHARQTSCCPSPGRPQIRCESVLLQREPFVRHVLHHCKWEWVSGTSGRTDRITQCLQSLSCSWCQRSTFQCLRPDESSPICTDKALRSNSCSTMQCRPLPDMCVRRIFGTLCAHAGQLRPSPFRKILETLGQLAFVDVAARAGLKSNNRGNRRNNFHTRSRLWSFS